MTLQDIVAGGKSVSLLSIGGDKALTRQIQLRLGELGVLDPPADGSFGPVSQWALGEFLKRAQLTKKQAVDAEVSKALLDADDTLFPLQSTQSFAGSLVKAMLQKGHWIARHPDCVNIVYVEGMDTDGAPNPNTPDQFNDFRAVIRIGRTGKPEFVELWDATTEPGRFFTLGSEAHPDGAARIAFGQYKSWSVGTHRKGGPTAHEALVQTAPIDIHRDLDRNFKRDNDRTFSGIFGINQHWGFDFPKTEIRKASAGCLVGRTKSGHRAFMALCKADPRFQANNGYRFLTAVLPGAEI